MPFIGELQYVRVKGKESYFGRSVFKLTRQFAYVRTIKGVVSVIVCKEGFETDFASIPEWIFFLRPRNGKWAKASVIHDKACILASEHAMTYKEADTIFYYAMREDDASWFTAMFIYTVVRINHLLDDKE